jgi:hypothetical protein
MRIYDYEKRSRKYGKWIEHEHRVVNNAFIDSFTQLEKCAFASNN